MEAKNKSRLCDCENEFCKTTPIGRKPTPIACKTKPIVFAIAVIIAVLPLAGCNPKRLNTRNNFIADISYDEQSNEAAVVFSLRKCDVRLGPLTDIIIEDCEWKNSRSRLYSFNLATGERRRICSFDRTEKTGCYRYSKQGELVNAIQLDGDRWLASVLINGSLADSRILLIDRKINKALEIGKARGRINKFDRFGDDIVFFASEYPIHESLADLYYGYPASATDPSAASALYRIDRSTLDIAGPIDVQQEVISDPEKKLLDYDISNDRQKIIMVYQDRIEIIDSEDEPRTIVEGDNGPFDSAVFAGEDDRLLYHCSVSNVVVEFNPLDGEQKIVGENIYSRLLDSADDGKILFAGSFWASEMLVVDGDGNYSLYTDNQDREILSRIIQPISDARALVGVKDRDESFELRLYESLPNGNYENIFRWN